jgi:hypothetical protein
VTGADCPDCLRCGEAGTTALADATAVEEFVCWACDHVFTLTPDGSTFVTTDTEIPDPANSDTPSPKPSPAVEDAELLLGLARQQTLNPVVDYPSAYKGVSEQDAAGASARALTAIGYTLMETSDRLTHRLTEHAHAQTRSLDALTQVLTAAVATSAANANAASRSADALESIATSLAALADRGDVADSVTEVGEAVGGLGQEVHDLSYDLTELLTAQRPRRRRVPWPWRQGKGCSV